MTIIRNNENDATNGEATWYRLFQYRRHAMAQSPPSTSTSCSNTTIERLTGTAQSRWSSCARSRTAEHAPGQSQRNTCNSWMMMNHSLRGIYVQLTLLAIVYIQSQFCINSHILRVTHQNTPFPFEGEVKRWTTGTAHSPDESEPMLPLSTNVSETNEHKQFGQIQ